MKREGRTKVGRSKGMKKQKGEGMKKEEDKIKEEAGK